MNRMELALYAADEKLKPLARALLETAKEQGATVERFKMAATIITQRIERDAERRLLAEVFPERSGDDV